MQGGCSCGAVRYELSAKPAWVNCCHCTWCQRETGSAFVVNALIETAHVRKLAGEPVAVLTPSASGKGQTIVRCPTCHVALWSHYAAGGPGLAFVRAGTLDQPNDVTPDIHIYTSTKRPWVVLPDGAPSTPEFYNPRETWPPEVLARVIAARTG